MMPASRRLIAACWSGSLMKVAMRIENTTFGAITIDGKTYEHDVVIRLSGEVVKRTPLETAGVQERVDV